MNVQLLQQFIEYVVGRVQIVGESRHLYNEGDVGGDVVIKFTVNIGNNPGP